MSQKKNRNITVLGILACLTLAGCGLGDNSPKASPAPQTQTQESSQPLVIDLDPSSQETLSEQSASSASQTQPSPSGEGNEYKTGSAIEAQTFDVNLNPFGPVTFASYEPDTSENPMADPVFLIEKDGQVLTRLPGIFQDNINTGVFNQVEAVSFPDYNHDTYDDVIIIISYYPEASSQAATPHSVIRYYSGTAKGNFVYEKQMSQDATSALAEISIKTAKDFISGEKADDPVPDPSLSESAISLKPWQQAYIRYLSEDSEAKAQRGYTLIRLSDDGIPQLAEIGIDEATGSRIVHYAKGKVHVTQLNRLSFSYIPEENLLCNSEGNMDYYYDLVYRLTDGEIVPVASGYYGAADNSRIQFDENGEPVYRYQWNQIEMTKDEYEKELSRVYDKSRAVTYDYDSLYSQDEMIKIIREYLW